MTGRDFDDDDSDADIPDDDTDNIDNGFDDDDEPTISCPYCGAEIHEDSPCCPSCGNYLSAEDTVTAAKPWWIIVGVILGMLAFVRWLFV